MTASWASDEWQPVRSDEGRFHLQMPGGPKTSELVEKTFLGPVKSHFLSVNLPSEEYTVEYSELPHLAFILGGPKTILKKARDALLQDVKADELAFRIFMDKGEERAELSYLGRYDKNPGVAGLARFFLKDERLIVLHVMMSDGRRIDPARVNRFLGSFAMD